MDSEENQLEKAPRDAKSHLENNPIPINEEDATRLVRTEVRQGSVVGQERVRVVLPSQRAFRRIGMGRLEATEVTQTPRSGWARLVGNFKRMLLGRPLPTSAFRQEGLTKIKALAVFAANPLSSVAYATEAILITLAAAGSRNLGFTLPIALVVVGLLCIITISYRQTIPAYPHGGGSYVVAKDNLGTLPGLIAAASLLIDYILTVSVSIAAVVQNLVSLASALGSYSRLQPYVVYIDVALIILVTIVHLRGQQEARTIFVISVYFFIVSTFLLIMVGFIKSFFILNQHAIGHYEFIIATQPLTFFLILKSIAAGGSALTGVEAFVDDVPAFKKPETRNAATTLIWMSVLLGMLFIGITLLAMSYHIEANASGSPTVIAQIAAKVFTGPLVWMFYVFQLAILFILFMAAYTSYSNFPRLASLLARDNFLPHQFSFRGDRLALSTGIMFVTISASLLLIGFKGDTTSLLPLYAEGVFLAFTLSQGGMALYWWRRRGEYKSKWSIVLNSSGAVATLIIALIIAFTKFLEGAWVIVLLIPLFVVMFLAISRHYHRVEREKVSDIPIRPQDIHHRVIVPIAGLDRASIQSLAYARSITKHVIAVHVTVDEDDANKVREVWERWQKHLAEEEETQLIIIESPYRSLSRPLLAYIDTVHELFPADTVTVILPEFVVAHWWERVLHNQTALRLRAALMFRPGIVVLSIRHHLRSR